MPLRESRLLNYEVCFSAGLSIKDSPLSETDENHWWVRCNKGFLDAEVTDRSGSTAP